MDRSRIGFANCLFNTLHRRKQFFVRWNYTIKFGGQFQLNFQGSGLKNANIQFGARLPRIDALIHQQKLKRAIIINTLLNQLVRSVLGNIGLVLFLQVYGPHKLAKKELDQYFPNTERTS